MSNDKKNIPPIDEYLYREYTPEEERPWREEILPKLLELQRRSPLSASGPLTEQDKATLREIAEIYEGSSEPPDPKAAKRFTEQIRAEGLLPREDAETTWIRLLPRLLAREPLSEEDQAAWSRAVGEFDLRAGRYKGRA